MKIQFPDTTIINEDDLQHVPLFFRIALSPIGGWYGIFASSLEDALEILGSYCDDYAKGYIVDASQMTDEELEEASLFHVNGSLDCSLDLSECMRDMVQEYRFNLEFQKIS